MRSLQAAIIMGSLFGTTLSLADTTGTPDTKVQSNPESTTITTTVPNSPDSTTTVTTTTVPGAATTTGTQSVMGPGSPTTQTVAPSVDPQQVAREDARVTSDIRNVIASDNSLASTNITATVSNGMVTLSGTVDNPAQADHVESLIRGMGGVKAVKSNLVIKGSASTSLGY